MVKGNMFTQTEAIILETGLKGKWKARGSCSIRMETSSMKANGWMTTFREKENYTIISICRTGSSMTDSSGQQVSKGLDNYFSKMETDTRGSLEMIYFGEKEDSLIKLAMLLRLEFGKKVSSYLNCDICLFLIDLDIYQLISADFN